MNLHLFDAYQEATARTDSDYSHVKPEDVPKLVHALGLAGEAGELADYIKKLAHGHPLDRDKILKEAGDVLWYVARILADFGWKMSEASTGNILKLQIRFPDKFNPEDSLARVDVIEQD